jgi:hypothetical protein
LTSLTTPLIPLARHETKIADILPTFPIQ